MSHGRLARLRAQSPIRGTRLLALGAVALALGAPLRTMYHLTDVVGSPTLFLVIVAVALAVATVTARILPPLVAVIVGFLLLGAGLGWYVSNLSTQPTIDPLLADVAALLTGRSLLQISNVRLWALSTAPAPVFLTWYFAVRRRYVMATVAVATTLGFFVLTTDAGLVTTLLGVVGCVATLGFGTLDAIEADSTPSRESAVDASRRPGPVAGSADSTDAGIDAGRRAVLEQLAAIILLPALLSRVPGVAGSALSFSGRDQKPTIEGSLVDADETLSVLGAITLSPTVRFAVEAPEPRYWRVAAYDRYTGDGWVRTGSTGPYGGGRLDGVPGDSRTLRQSVEVKSDVGTLPAAWRPVRVRGDVDVGVTSHGGLQPMTDLAPGDRYEVLSEVLVATPTQLRESGGEYPQDIVETYTRLPESTPDRVAERTSILTANAQNHYEVALVVEQWLRNNKGYSLDVRKPRRNVADAFLFEMDEGYCVYFATTMVTMLRTQGIPARFVVGYTPGERVAENRWVVRGLDSHAWVEVYVADQGWVQFDPTPSGPREAAEQRRLDEARGASAPDVDTGETGNNSEFTETSTPTPPPLNDTETSANATTPTPATPGGEAGPATPPGQGQGSGGGGGFTLPALPSREEAALGLLALVGIAAGARRTGITDRLQRAYWLRYQRREDPATDVEVAFQRAMYVLGEQTRKRGAGETVRAYLDAVDASERVRRLASLREQARYAGTVDEAVADEAVELADGVVGDREAVSRGVHSPDSV